MNQHNFRILRHLLQAKEYRILPFLSPLRYGNDFLPAVFLRHLPHILQGISSCHQNDIPNTRRFFKFFNRMCKNFLSAKGQKLLADFRSHASALSCRYNHSRTDAHLFFLPIQQKCEIKQADFALLLSLFMPQQSFL